MGAMNSASDIVVRQVSPEEVYPLRHKVLRPNQALAACVWAQDAEADTAHFAAVLYSQIVGIASIAICPREGDSPNTWRLRGMATEPELRGQGIGAKVLAMCLEHTKSRGGSLIWCNARTSALEFYRKYGFETVGDEFETPGVGPHFVMVRPL